MALDFSAAGHDKGDKGCDACHSALNARGAFPEPHQCGGLLHADPAEEDDGSAMQDIKVGKDGATVADIVNLCCDTCGATGTRAMPQAAVNATHSKEKGTTGRT